MTEAQPHAKQLANGESNRRTSQGRPVIGWIRVKPKGDITRPEREQTFGWSRFARELAEPIKEDMQMTVKTGAAPDRMVNWHDIDWAKAHQMVHRLQVRIERAVKEGTPIVAGLLCEEGYAEA